MPVQQRQFLVKTPDGEEHGPVDQETLQRWTESGRVTSDCMVRNTLVPRWTQASDVPFLKAIIAAKEAEEVANETPGLTDKLKERITQSAIVDKRLPGLAAGERFIFTPASIPLRLAAGVLDFLVILAYLLAVYAVMGVLVKTETLTMGQAFEFGVPLAYGGSLLYLAWSVGFHAQTPGQRFWGLMVVRKEGEQVFLGRAFFFAFGVFLFGWLSPFVVYVVPSKRGIGELLSGTRVVRTRVLSSNSWTG